MSDGRVVFERDEIPAALGQTHTSMNMHVATDACSEESKGKRREANCFKHFPRRERHETHDNPVSKMPTGKCTRAHRFVSADQQPLCRDSNGHRKPGVCDERCAREECNANGRCSTVEPRMLDLIAKTWNPKELRESDEK